MVTRKRVVEQCDNPNCTNQFDITNGDIAPGVYITAGTIVTHAASGPLPSVYACTFECIPDATEARIRKNDT